MKVLLWGMWEAWFLLAFLSSKPALWEIFCLSTWAFLPLASDCGCPSPSSREWLSHHCPLSPPSHPRVPITAVFISSSSPCFSDHSILRWPQEEEWTLLIFIFSAFMEANGRKSWDAHQSFAASSRKRGIITVGSWYQWVLNLWTQLNVHQGK